MRGSVANKRISDQGRVSSGRRCNVHFFRRYTHHSKIRMGMRTFFRMLRLWNCEDFPYLLVGAKQ
jgi:hypothetical protein